jgi:hypothetical protein
LTARNESKPPAWLAEIRIGLANLLRAKRGRFVSESHLLVFSNESVRLSSEATCEMRKVKLFETSRSGGRILPSYSCSVFLTTRNENKPSV